MSTCRGLDQKQDYHTSSGNPRRGTLCPSRSDVHSQDASQPALSNATKFTDTSSITVLLRKIHTLNVLAPGKLPNSEFLVRRAVCEAMVKNIVDY